LNTTTEDGEFSIISISNVMDNKTLLSIHLTMSFRI